MGFFNKTGGENEEVISLINRLSPDILLVGFGMPLQEKWITANFDRLNPHVFFECRCIVPMDIRRRQKSASDPCLQWHGGRMAALYPDIQGLEKIYC